MTTPRLLAPIALASVMVLGLAACADPTLPTAPVTLGRLIAQGSLTLADGNQIPCCTTTAPNTRVTIIGGALSLYRLAQYTDTVSTPGGLASAACVQEVPNGASVSLGGLVTLPDGRTYLLLTCSVGTYHLTLTEHAVHPDGSSETTDTLVISGSFNWQRDRLTLADFSVHGVTASLSGATVTVAAAGHHYQFVVSSVR